MTTAFDPIIQAAYDEMWQRGSDAFSRGHVDIDPVLSDLEHDDRMGLGCIIRPRVAALPAVQVFLDELAERAPGQHLYQAEDLHVSVLTPVPSFVGFDLDQLPLGSFGDIFAAVSGTQKPFTLTFTGLTATPNAIMLQGFFAPGTLDALRLALRAGLERAGLAAGMDRRYPLRGAHMTALRFRSAPADLGVLQRWLSSLRRAAFGTSPVTAVELVTADWYMSHDKVRTVAYFPLEGA